VSYSKRRRHLALARPSVDGDPTRRREGRDRVQRPAPLRVARDLVERSVEVCVGGLFSQLPVLESVPRVDLAVVVPVLGAAEDLPAAEDVQQAVGPAVMVGVLTPSLSAFAVELRRRRRAQDILIIGTIRPLVEPDVARDENGREQDGNTEGTGAKSHALVVYQSLVENRRVTCRGLGSDRSYGDSPRRRSCWHAHSSSPLQPRR
jgi:hypothetical protein